MLFSIVFAAKKFNFNHWCHRRFVMQVCEEYKVFELLFILKIIINTRIP